MADELTAELLNKVKKSFNRRRENHPLIQQVEKKVLDGIADLVDVQAYSGSLGSQLALALMDCIDFKELPNERLYYELAKDLLGETLKTNYELVNAAAAEVLKTLDAKVGYKLKIKPQKPKFPTDRVKKVAKSVCDPNVPQSTIERRLTSPIENISESFYTDFVKENAEFRARSGIETYIVRKDGGNCCEWCAKLAGKYPYGEEPKDVYRRHDNCTCTVTFENGRQRQNVWTKATWTADEETLEQRKEFADKKPTVLTREQAKQL